MSIFNFRRKSKTVINWNFSNDMKPNIKNYDENYDKLNSLKHFLLKNDFSNEEIEEIINHREPFEIVNRMIKAKQQEKYKRNPYVNLSEFNFYNSVECLKLNVIRDIEYKSIVSILFNTMIQGILLASGFDYNAKYPNSDNTYSTFINELGSGNFVLDDDTMTCFHIIFSRSKKNITDFLQDFEWSWSNLPSTIYYKYIDYVNGLEYVKGIFYKIIENSINNHKTYNAKKIIDSNEINTLIDYDVHNILFSSNSNDNQVLFRECFEDFRNDLLNIRYFIKEANDLVYNKLFDYEINDNILFDSNNYFVNFKAYTNTGRKSKYPFNIEGAFVLSRKNELTVNLLYNRTGQVSRIEISMESSNIHRMIIIKEINNELILSEIKEHDIMVDAFPNVIYKYNE